MRRLIVRSLIVLGCMVACLSASPAIFAAPKIASNSQPFWVTGASGTITQVASLVAYKQPGMTYYRIPAAYQGMLQARFYVVRGQYTLEGRWQYQFGVHMAAGIFAESVEVGQNAKEHVEMIAVGIQPQSNVQPLTNTSTANLASVVYDPLNIQLIQVFDYLTYYWDGTCVTGISAHFPGTILYPDGWYTLNESHSSGHGCGGGYAYTNGLYTNPIFCANNATDVSFTPQSEGLYNGSRYYNAGYGASGNCAGLLHWGQHWN